MWRDFQFGLRALARQPLLATVVVLTVALGVGGATAVFSVVNAVLLRDLPYPDAGRIYVMRAIVGGGPSVEISRGEFAPIYEHDDHPIVESAAIVWSRESQIVGSDGRPHPIVGYGVSDRFFDVFGPRMALGRGFEPSDPTASIVISHQIWRDVFASDPDIIGKTVMAEGTPRPVVGVTPAGFAFPQNPGFWSLMRIGAPYDHIRGFGAFMRLRPDRTPAQLRGDLARLSETLGLDADTNQRPILIAQPFLEFVVGDLKPTVLVLFGATGLLLLVAAINVTNLLLARSAVRTREVALREALGAGRWRIVRQLMTETIALVAAGGALGLAVAIAGVRGIMGMAPEGLPRLDAVPIDRTVLLFAAGLTLLTGLAVGAAPAWRLARTDLRSLLNEGGRGTPGGPARNRLFGALVVTEIALAVVLVMGAGLLIRSYINLTVTDPGFSSDRILTVTMNVSGRLAFPMDALGRPRQDVSPYAPLAVFFRELEERLAGISGVESVAMATHLPLAQHPFPAIVTATLPDRRGAGGDDERTMLVRSVSPTYFETLAMRLLNGRGLARSDREGAPGVAVINEAYARRYFADTDPIGQRIRLRYNRYLPTDTGFQFGHLALEEMEVVGVVTDAKHVSLAQPAEAAIYVSSEQFYDRRRTFILRTSLDRPELVAPAVRREIDAMDAQLAAKIAPYAPMVHASIARERLSMTLLVAFGVTALLLAAVGVYGLMSYSVAQRTGEIALRSAMGASRSQIVGLVMGRGLRLAVAGVALGVLGAVALRQVIAGQLYGVSALDLPVFVLVTTTLFGVAALACFVPARRAANVDPADLLRTE